MEAKSVALQEEGATREAKADAQADAHLERMEAIMRSIPSDIDRILQQQIEAWKERYLSNEERTTICRVPPVACSDNSEGDVITSEESSEKMDATRLEASPEETEADVITFEESSEEMEINREETEAAVECQELQMEEADVEALGSSEDRYGDRLLFVRLRRGAKKRTQHSVGFRQSLFAARKRMIIRAVPAVRKGQMRKGPGTDRTTRVAPKRKKVKNTLRMGQECNISLRNRGPKNQLYLRMRRTFSRSYRTLMQLEIPKIIFGSTIELQDVNDWKFWKVWPPSKRKKEVRTA
jgi:hypothetical protein